MSFCAVSLKKTAKILRNGHKGGIKFQCVSFMGWYHHMICLPHIFEQEAKIFTDGYPDTAITNNETIHTKLPAVAVQ